MNVDLVSHLNAHAAATTDFSDSVRELPQPKVEGIDNDTLLAAGARIRAALDALRPAEHAAKQVRADLKEHRLALGKALIDARNAFPECGPNAKGWSTYVENWGLSVRKAHRYMVSAGYVSAGATPAPDRDEGSSLTRAWKRATPAERQALLDHIERERVGSDEQAKASDRVEQLIAVRKTMHRATESQSRLAQKIVDGGDQVELERAWRALEDGEGVADDLPYPLELAFRPLRRAHRREMQKQEREAAEREAA